MCAYAVLKIICYWLHFKSKDAYGIYPVKWEILMKMKNGYWSWNRHQNALWDNLCTKEMKKKCVEWKLKGKSMLLQLDRMPFLLDFRQTDSSDHSLGRPI